MCEEVPTHRANETEPGVGGDVYFLKPFKTCPLSNPLLEWKDEPKSSFNQVSLFVSHTLTPDTSSRVCS